ncbi:MAG: hypothetical protein A4E32_00193 [Methanomassiliicoccales archaeon PtaU1.Bin124]|nr:MAG: hypothetical protein A4E32_00193 [Methanomassiliicoccales archaeon PtaU1.Bin124]
MNVEINDQTMCAEGHVPKDMRWRIYLSIFTVFAGMAFVVTWLFFYAGDHSFWENLGVLILSFLIFVGVNAAFWVPFGLRHAPMDESWQVPEKKGWASAVIGVGACLFLIVWLLLYADDYSIYQNLAVLLSVLVVGGGLGAAVWGWKNRGRW